MKLVDFLILLLEAHAQTLQRLAALFGEEILLHMLEVAGERADEAAAAERDAQRILASGAGNGATNVAVLGRPASQASSWIQPYTRNLSGEVYAQLESAVTSFKLPEVLEFHLWAYPHYRAFIESHLDLESRIPGPGPEACSVVVEEAVTQAEAWVRKLPIAPEFAAQAEKAAHIPWIRFRTVALKRIGKRPMGAVAVDHGPRA